MKRRSVLPLIAILLLGNLAVSTADTAQPGGVTIGPDVGAQGGGEGEEEEAEEAGGRGAPETRVARSSFVAAAAWQPLGPSNVGGRITDLVVDPVRTDTVYAGAATGGVWRSVDGGRTFNSAWPATITPSIGALAITPGGT